MYYKREDNYIIFRLYNIQNYFAHHLVLILQKSKTLSYFHNLLTNKSEKKGY